MDTVALQSWVIRDVGDDAVEMEELVDGEPNGVRVAFERALLPDDVCAGDQFRVLAQIDRNSEEILSHPAFGEATAALAAGAFKNS